MAPHAPLQPGFWVEAEEQGLQASTFPRTRDCTARSLRVTTEAFPHMQQALG